MIAKKNYMVIKLKLFNGKVTIGKFFKTWQMCFEVDFFIITFFFIMDTLCHWLECLFIICCERVYICTFKNVSCNQAKNTTSALVHTVAPLQQYYNLFKLEYKYMYLYLVITCKQNKKGQNVSVDPFSKPQWPSSVQQVCVCVCCEYSTLGGQRVYCYPSTFHSFLSLRSKEFHPGDTNWSVCIEKPCVCSCVPVCESLSVLIVKYCLVW